MREILFRGQRIDNGEWVEGNLAAYDLICPDYPEDTYNATGDYYDQTPYVGFVEVIFETVGQYTGLTDKNGKRIFEGDIFHLDEELIAVIIFKDGCFRLQVYGLCGTYTESGYDECGGGWGIVECEPIDWYYIHDMEIIGNIHDNPELLKGENNV